MIIKSKGFTYLVGTADEIEIMLPQELGYLICTKRVRHPSVVLPPPLDLAVGIWPQEVAEQALVGDIDGALNPTNLVHVLKLRRQPPVRAEDLVVDNSSDREAVEAVGEELPEADTEAALALIVEAVDTVDGGTLVVAAEQEEIVRVLDLVAEEEADGLNALLPAVHVVAQEEVVWLRREATVFEQPEEVWELTVDVAWIKFKTVFLFNNQLLLGKSVSNHFD